MGDRQGEKGGELLKQRAYTYSFWLGYDMEGNRVQGHGQDLESSLESRLLTHPVPEQVT